MNQPHRNQPCPCGSGKRYKQCCGALAGSAAVPPPPSQTEVAARFTSLMNQALAAQTSEHLVEAESLYRAALALDPRSFDAMHMLGVVCFQLGRAEEACRLLMAALPLQTTDYPPFFQNLGLCLAAVAATRGVMRKSTDFEQQGRAYLGFFRRGNLPPLPANPPRVSIVAPCYNHERYVADAIASVCRQTYPNIELIVIDDGSTDGSVAAIARALTDCPFPHHFLHRENRGAHATLNEGVELASGDCIGILNTDDIYIPERTEFMVRMLLGAQARWGFSNLAYMDDESRPIRYGQHPRVDAMMKYHDALYRSQTVSAGFSTHNHAISTGNLFLERSLWRDIGGFEALRYNHDWAFCLAAILVAEPAYLDEPAYCYRLHGGNTIIESRERARQEADAILSCWHRTFASKSAIANLALTEARRNSRKVDFANMANGSGHVIDRANLLTYAAELGFEPTAISNA